MPDATDAAAAPLEPPGVISVFQGLSETPCNGLDVHQRMENSGVLVRAIITAPDDLRLVTTGASPSPVMSLKAGMPLVFG